MPDGVLLFPFAESLPLYAGFLVLVFLVLLLDLGVFHRNPHEVSFKEAAGWSVFWVSLAGIFNVLLYWFSLNRFSTDPQLLAIPGFSPEVAAKQTALEFLTGYVVEKSLAVDNLFVFITVFSFFGIPNKYQHKILFYGILGALFFRAVFIAMGSYLMEFHAVVIFFGVLLIFTGIKLVFTPETKDENLSDNILLRFLERVLPVTKKRDGAKFFITENGRKLATPLFVSLIFLEFTDIIFAVDSVPAIFALTKEPFIVFTSNIFAILGLRSMYFMLAGVADRFVYLKYGLAAVLVFVGLKMAWLNQLFDGKFPIGISLLLIALFIGSSMAISLIVTKKHTPRGGPAGS